VGKGKESVKGKGRREKEGGRIRKKEKGEMNAQHRTSNIQYRMKDTPWGGQTQGPPVQWGRGKGDSFIVDRLSLFGGIPHGGTSEARGAYQCFHFFL